LTTGITTINLSPAINCTMLWGGGVLVYRLQDRCPIIHVRGLDILIYWHCGGHRRMQGYSVVSEVTREYPWLHIILQLAS
jgi:hypothetical protein